jgi:hypothetical protein
MPYYVHPVNEPLESAIVAFFAKPDAIAFRASRPEPLTLSFVATAEQINHWRDREADRFTSGEYVRVPWESEYFGSGAIAQHIHHYAHVSTDDPGKIAYTPDDEYGTQNRKIRVRPGRYLQQFAPDMSAADRERFAAACTGLTSGDRFLLARSEKDITTVCLHGPASCMGGPAHSLSDYDSAPIHPMAVYADSPDLALAYLGEKTAALARAIVWPERQLFTIVYPSYGSGTEHAERLRTALCAAGYSYSKLLRGARIRKIVHDSDVDSYVMAYLDCASSIGHDSADRRYWILDDGRSTDLDVMVTNGVTGDQRACEHCGDRCPRDETYCESCDSDRWSCTQCGEDSFNMDDACNLDGEYYCESCADRYGWHCTDCGDRGLTRNDEYNIINDSEVCERCTDRHYAYCDACEEYYDSRDRDRCPDCPEESDEDSDEDSNDNPDEDSSEDSDDRSLASINPCLPFVRIQYKDSTVNVSVLTSYGPFTAHETYKGTGFAVTHMLTGLAVTQGLESLAIAVDVMRRLAVPGMDWSFTDRASMSPATERHGFAIVRSITR